MLALRALMLAIIPVWLVFLLVAPAQLPHFVYLALTALLSTLPTVRASQLVLQAITMTLMETVLSAFRLAPPAPQLLSASVVP